MWATGRYGDTGGEMYVGEFQESYVDFEGGICNMRSYYVAKKLWVPVDIMNA